MSKPKILFTIGYEGADIRDFIETLRNAGVEKLLDVREIANSRRKGFSKNVLAKALEQAGIGYLHLRGLGDPKPGRDAARSGNMALFQRIFSAHMGEPSAKADLSIAITEATATVVCLMCFERAPADCHRSIVAGKISNKTDLEVSHLGVRDGAYRARQTARKVSRSREGLAARGAEAR